MLLDKELYLTPTAGQLFNAADTASEYTSRPLDLLASALNPMVGEPLEAWAMAKGADCDVGTSLTLAIVMDDDGAGTNEVVLATVTKAVAALQVADGAFRIGTLSRTATLGAAGRYIGCKVTTSGTAATAGTIAIWLQKGSHVAPANEANTL